MDEKIKACYIAFYRTKNVASINDAFAELRKLHSSIYLAKDLQSFHNITVDTPIIEDESISDAEAIIELYKYRGR
ncbi:MAG: hypothetical protein ACXAC5_05405 [Promethearchaeota archaeon]|jgi:hypothetical protein